MTHITRIGWPSRVAWPASGKLEGSFELRVWGFRVQGLDSSFEESIPEPKSR